MLHSSQEVDSRLDPGLDEHKWHLPAIRVLLYYLVVGQGLPRIYRIPDIKVDLVVWKQTTSRSILVHTGLAAFPQGMPIQNDLIVQHSPIMSITDLTTVRYEHA